MNVQDAINAIRQNGLPKVKYVYLGFWETPEGNLVYGGCALGQGAKNLEITGDKLAFRLALTKITVEKYPLDEYIIKKNDETDMTLPEIADHLEQVLTEEQRALKI